MLYIYGFKLFFRQGNVPELLGFHQSSQCYDRDVDFAGPVGYAGMSCEYL